MFLWDYFFAIQLLTTLIVNANITMTNKVVNKTNIIVKGGMKMPLYNRLKEYRAKKDLNQQQLGSLVGASRQTISLIERGDYSPSVTLAIKIAEVFDAKVEDIFIYEEDE